MLDMKGKARVHASVNEKVQCCTYTLANYHQERRFIIKTINSTIK